MKIRLESEDAWVVPIVAFANDIVDEGRRAGLSLGQVAMAATLVLQRLVEANELAKDTRIEIISHATWDASK